MPKLQQSTVTSGLGATAIFLPYEVNRVRWTSAGWSGSKAFQIHTSDTRDGVFVAERKSEDSDDPYTSSANGSIIIYGPTWAKPFVSDADSDAVTLSFYDTYADDGQ